MLFDFLQHTANLILALFLLRMLQLRLISKDSDLGRALSFLLH